MNDIELKPCPFCGGEAKIAQVQTVENHRFWQDGMWFLKVEHKKHCQLEFFDVFSFHGEYSEEKGYSPFPEAKAQEAIDRWNNRA